MHPASIDGEWSGHYQYGEGYPFTHRGRRKRFTIDWRLSDGVITGTCIDDLVKESLTQPATIDGTFDKRSVRFTKRYACLLQRDAENYLRITPEEPSYEVHYAGRLRKRLFGDKTWFSGRWHIEVLYYDRKKLPRIHILRGNWKMYRT